MHSYDRLVPPGQMPTLPPISSLTFDLADDLVALAQIDVSMGWRTWPEVWHLDDEGRLSCYLKGSSLDSARRWANNPDPFLRSRSEGLDGRNCGNRWVIIESRPSWLRPPVTIDELDTAAFLQLRRDLSSVDVNLLDVVIFDDRLHWWSLHELTFGTTVWPGCQAPLPGTTR